MRTIETTVYKFAELPTEKAKERARQWYREHNLDYDWWEYTYDWYANILAALGVCPKQKPTGRKKNKDGVMVNVYGPAFYFSGFWSQGDGASWEGDYHYRTGWRKLLAKETSDKDLFLIGEKLQDIQKRNMYQLRARVYTRGHYSHSNTMHMDQLWRDDDKGVVEYFSTETEVLRIFRDLADWLYARLEEEYDHLQSDEVVDESMEANGYEFEENGEPV